MKNSVFCPGCGVVIASAEKTLDKDFNALAACRSLCFELSYFTLELGDNYFLHQLLVDAYAAQHSGPHVKSISTAFGLAGLYLVWEKGFTGRQVQLAHMEMAKSSKTWPRFQVPEKRDWITVKEVLEVPVSERQDMIKKWHKSVWDVWKVEKEKIAGLIY
jgi:hypothetical protein